LPAAALEKHQQVLPPAGPTWFQKLGFVSRAQAVILLTSYACFLLLGLYVIHRGGCFAQDLVDHVERTKLLVTDPAKLLANNTIEDPLLLYALSVPAAWLVGTDAYHFVAPSCVLFLLINLMAMHLFFLVAQRLCKAPIATALTVAFLALLPATVCTSVVYSSDTLTTLPFVAYVYSMLRIADKRATKLPLPFCLLAAVSMCFGAFSKYSFITFTPASVVIFLAICLQKQYRLKQLMLIFASTVLIPGMVVAGAQKHPFPLAYPPPKGAMSVAQYVPRMKDKDLLSAPFYWDPITANGTPILVDDFGKPDPQGHQGYVILVNDRYSYPALFTLAINTDVSSIAQGGVFPQWRVHRHRFNQNLEQCSIALGYLSAIGFVLASAFAAGSLWRRRIADGADLVPMIILAVPTLGFYSVVTLFLPFVKGAIYEGYWLPRLVYPTIIGFGIIALYGWVKMDSALAGHPKLRAVARSLWCAMVVYQTIIHALILCT